MMTQMVSMPVIDMSVGSIDRYITVANSYPLLTQEEEFELARRLKEENDLDAARCLVLSHLRLVISIARGYLGYGLPHADLIQEGNIGLMKAVRRFDPARGVRLVSFATYWIKAEINDFIVKNWRLVKVATTKAHRKLFFNLRSKKKSDKSLTVSEANDIARDLDVAPNDVFEMEQRMTGKDLSLYADTQDAENNQTAPIDWLAEQQPDPSDRLLNEQHGQHQLDGLQEALMRLDERSRSIIESRWLSEDKTATLQALATQFGLSPERIRQIEAQAMKKMRHWMCDTDAA